MISFPTKISSQSKVKYVFTLFIIKEKWAEKGIFLKKHLQDCDNLAMIVSYLSEKRLIE